MSRVSGVPSGRRVTRAALEVVELYYEVAGTGPHLLLISGTGGDLRSSPRVFDGPLATRFEIAAYDQRGLGQSSIPPGPYAMADYADDAAGLLDVLAWEDALVIHQSVFPGQGVEETGGIVGVVGHGIGPGGHRRLTESALVVRGDLELLGQGTVEHTGRGP